MNPAAPSQNNNYGDVRLLSLTLRSSLNGNVYDLLGQLISISIYEDIEFPVVRAEISLLDPYNLLRNLPIVGEEELEISFVSPFVDTITTYNLSVYTVTGVTPGVMGRAASYTLKCVSAEHKLNSIKTLDKYYNDTIDNIITSILKGELNSSRNIYTEKTKGIQSIIIPKISPFAAVDMLRQRAINSMPTGGTFTFYENQKGFHLRSLEGLIKECTSNGDLDLFNYIHTPIVSTGKDFDYLKFRSLIKYEHLVRFDSAAKIIRGLMKTNVVSFDVNTKNSKLEKEFNIISDGGTLSINGIKYSLPLPDNVLKKSAGSDPITMFMPKDTSKPNDYLPEYQAYRTAFKALFNQSVMRCYVYGDSRLAVGRAVNLDLPSPDTTDSVEKNEVFTSGAYIVTKLRHIIRTEQSRLRYYISFDCNWAGVPK